MVGLSLSVSSVVYGELSRNEAVVGVPVSMSSVVYGELSVN